MSTFVMNLNDDRRDAQALKVDGAIVQDFLLLSIPVLKPRADATLLPC